MAPRSHLRWWIICLIGVATVINYVDRTSLAVMWPAITKDTGLSKDAYASIVSVFMVCYALGQGISGRFFDRVGTRLGFVVSIVAWSIACALHGAARSALSLGAFRGLLGFAEAGNWPGATKAVAEWFPRHERAFAQGIFNAGASLGAVVSAPLIAWLFVLCGWRATFVVVGAFGLIWLIPWWILARAGPDQHPWVSPEERAHILGGDAAATVPPPATPALSWTAALSLRQTWAVVVSRFFLDPVWWLFVNWLPIYLTDRFGFDVKQIGLFGWVPYLGAAIGSLSGGWYSGHLLRQGWTVHRARKRAILLGAAMTVPGFIGAVTAGSPLAAVVAIAVVLAGFQVAINNIQTLPSDYFAGPLVGTVAGIGGMGAVAGVLVFSTWLVPVLSRISYTPVFVMAALLVPVAVGSLFLLGGEIRRVDVPAGANPKY